MKSPQLEDMLEEQGVTYEEFESFMRELALFKHNVSSDVRQQCLPETLYLPNRAQRRAMRRSR